MRGIRGEISRFLLAGAVNTFFGYAVFSSIYFCVHQETAALAWSYIAGVCFNYRTYGRYVFGDGRHLAFVRFVLVYLLTFGLNRYGLSVLTESCGINAYAAQLILAAIIAPVLYLLNKRFVFR